MGPGVAENESPKRQIRSASQAPTTRKKTPTAPSATSAGTERKPRPCKYIKSRATHHDENKKKKKNTYVVNYERTSLFVRWIIALFWFLM